jgi:phosphopantetheine adenylyltransferase
MASDGPVLLLLPPLPQPPTYAALKAAYHAPLLTLLLSLSQAQSQPPPSQRQTLDIALLCPHLWSNPSAPRSAQFAKTQKAIANIYKLICIISAKNRLNVEGDEGLDTRVLLVRYPRDGDLTTKNGLGAMAEAENLGPVVGIDTLASSSRWRTVYSVESEQGQTALEHFQRFSRAKVEVQRLRGGIVQVSSSTSDSSISDSSSSGHGRRHYSVANGGTYDHLHIGHKLLLTMTAFAIDSPPQSKFSSSASLTDSPEEQERVITIGLTAEDLLKNKKYAEFLESWHKRYEVTHAFMRGILAFWPDWSSGTRETIQEIHNSGPNGHAIHVRLPGNLVIRYVEIWDPFGPTITDKAISALVLSEETRKGGQMVNDKRAEMGWNPLEVFEIDVLDSVEDEGETQQREQPEGVEKSFAAKLSSTEIRKARSERMGVRGSKV